MNFICANAIPYQSIGPTSTISKVTFDEEILKRNGLNAHTGLYKEYEEFVKFPESQKQLVRYIRFRRDYCAHFYFYQRNTNNSIIGSINSVKEKKAVLKIKNEFGTLSKTGNFGIMWKIGKICTVRETINRATR